MEEKQPVVIQGRAIERVRSTERIRPTSLRTYTNPYPYRGNVRRADALEDDGSGTYDLAILRRSRSTGSRSAGGRDPKPLMPRVSTGGIRPRQRISKEEPQHNTLMIRIGVSVVLALIVFLLNSIPLPFTQKVVDQIKVALTKDFDPDEALGKLKFVGDALPDQIKAVFNQGPDQQEVGQPVFSSPVHGKVIRSFGDPVILSDTGKGYINKGIDIQTEENAVVYASEKGIIAAVEDHDTYGKSIWLDHGNQVFTFYGGCDEIKVTKGQQVNKGHLLGITASSSQEEPVLHFQIWMDDKPVDPLEQITGPGQESEGV